MMSMEKKLLLVGIALVLIILVSGCIGPTERLEIVEYSIAGGANEVEVGEKIQVYIKAESDLGLRGIGFNAFDRTFAHNCDNKKSCNFTWEERTSLTGEHEIIIGAEDSNGNRVQLSEKVTIWPVEVPAFVASSTDNGRLEQKNGIWLLSLWGDPYEMGYAHGYLLAPQIKRLLESAVIAPHIRERYEEIIFELSDEFIFNQDQLNELQGILDGMRASGIEMKLNNREIGINDLKFMQHYNEKFDVSYTRACTSITAFGDLTEDGKTITSRGLAIAVNNIVGSTEVASTIIIAYEPEGRNKFLTVGFPGIIGCITCVNENGATVFLNNAQEREPEPSNPPYSISLLTMREFMETQTENPIQEVDELYDSKNPFGGFTMIITRTSDKGSGEIAGGLEYDNHGHVMRVVGDLDERGNYFIVPNNNFKLLGGKKENDWRYMLIENDLENFMTTGDGLVDREEMRLIFENIIDNNRRDDPVQQHVLIMNLDDMEFDLYVGKFEGLDFIAAVKAEKHTFSWSDFFPNN